VGVDTRFEVIVGVGRGVWGVAKTCGGFRVGSITGVSVAAGVSVGVGVNSTLTVSLHDIADTKELRSIAAIIRY
jgi:hypothetical protein